MTSPWLASYLSNIIGLGCVKHDGPRHIARVFLVVLHSKAKAGCFLRDSLHSLDRMDERRTLLPSPLVSPRKLMMNWRAEFCDPSVALDVRCCQKQ